MARIIINEGTGPQSIELSGLVVVGSNPSCDVVLSDPSALGVRLELKPLKFGYRAKRLKGDALLNEAGFDMADLDHNDTLRIGDVLLLYKQPEGADFNPAVVVPEDLELLDELALEELPELDEVEELEELEVLEELPELEVLELEDEAASEVEEIDLLANAKPAPAVMPDAGFEEALVRARWKRLELLRRLQLVQDGAVEEFPGLRAHGALDEVQHLDLEGRTGPLEAFEAANELQELSLAELQERIDAAREAAAVELEEELEELPVLAEVEEIEEQEELEELPVLEELDDAELEPLEELELVEEEALPELDASDFEPLEAAATVAAVPVMAGAAAASAGAAAASSSATAPRSAPPVGVRPVPPEGLRWKRPLPPGRRGPSYLPPSRPGAPRP